MSHADNSDPSRQLNDLGQLSAGVGHHVINAFSAIVSNAELLRLLADSPRPVDTVALADVIIRTAVEASGVARRLIDYSRTATATGQAGVALEEVVERVIAEEQARGESELSWERNLAPVPTIRGDAEQLAEMLRLLICNAREAMPASGGTIGVRTAIDERGWVVLEVHDTGQGMTAQARERAIEPFFTTKAGHLGVGLSIANGIWRRHRGTLALRSQAGEGTRVRLCVEPEQSNRTDVPV